MLTVLTLQILVLQSLLKILGLVLQSLEITTPSDCSWMVLRLVRQVTLRPMLQNQLRLVLIGRIATPSLVIWMRFVSLILSVTLLHTLLQLVCSKVMQTPYYFSILMVQTSPPLSVIGLVYLPGTRVMSSSMATLTSDSMTLLTKS